MKKEAWKPDHAISKGYPYDFIDSRDKFKNRLTLTQNAKTLQVGIIYNKEHYPKFKGINWAHRLFAGSVIDFLLHRLFDYGKSLEVAETQIEDLLFEQPFIPEEFGFEVAVAPKSIKDNPTKIWQSSLDNRFSIFRVEGPHWRLLERKGPDEFRETPLYLPCHRIAYALFVGLQVKVEEIEVDEPKPEPATP